MGSKTALVISESGDGYAVFVEHRHMGYALFNQKQPSHQCYIRRFRKKRRNNPYSDSI